MLGSLFAGTDESPGEVFLYQGRSYKYYRGMGSIRAMAQAPPTAISSRKSPITLKLVPEGIEGRVPHKGAVGQHHLSADRRLARAAMGYTGNRTIAEMPEELDHLWCGITNAGLRRSSRALGVAITRRSAELPAGYCGKAHEHASIIKTSSPRREGPQTMYRWLHRECLRTIRTPLLRAARGKFALTPTMKKRGPGT